MLRYANGSICELSLRKLNNQPHTKSPSILLILLSKHSPDEGATFDVKDLRDCVTLA